jgi:hypothetical protein
MTMTNDPNAGDWADRVNRRMLVFLEAQKFSTNLTMAKNTVSTIPAGTPLANRITSLINKLAIQADQQYGTGALIQQKFTELRTQPQIFLQNERLKSGIIGNNPQNYFYYEYNKDQYRIDMTQPAQYSHAHQFNAITVPAVPWFNVPGRTSDPTNGSFATIAGTRLDHGISSVMISTMFSGCSFCFKQETASRHIYAAHIMPDDGANNNVVQGGGTGLAQQLGGQVGTVAPGDFDHTKPGIFHVYGTGWSDLGGSLNGGYPVRTTDDEFMNIFGTWIGGTWQIWSQHIRDANKTRVRVL